MTYRKGRVAEIVLRVKITPMARTIAGAYLANICAYSHLGTAMKEEGMTVWRSYGR